MKALIVAKSLIGMRGRENDIWENPRIGELVIPPFPVQVPVGSFADDEDGISRSFYALSSGKRTSVALIRDVPISAEAYAEQVREFLVNFVFQGQALTESFNYGKVVRTHIERTASLIHSLRFNDLVEIRDGRISTRTIPKLTTAKGLTRTGA